MNRRNRIERRVKRKARLDYESEMYEKERENSIPAVPSEWGPGVDGVPTDLLYSDRGPRDVVLSGPLGKKVSGSKSPGRWFATPWEAVVWAKEKYGEERVRLIYPKSIFEEGAVRWAVLVKNLRS